jgi:carboxypeptidase Taq
MSGNEAYGLLERRFLRLGLLGEAASMLSWDRSTMMPVGSASARTDQQTELSLICHELTIDPQLADWLAEADEQAGELDFWQRANLREMRNEWRHQNAVAQDLVEALARACARCELSWREARPNDDFSAIREPLTEVVKLVREVAAAKSEAFGCSPYEALLDQFEPGGKTAEIDLLFDAIAEFLPQLRVEVLERQAQRPEPLPLRGPFPQEIQRELGEDLMGALGFPFECGRLDVSLHPFSGGTPDDLRITTRYDEDNFTSALMGVLHETGHALYERGLPEKWRRQPVGSARGMGLHESQSLLVEMQVCRSRGFIAFAGPRMRAAFKSEGPEWTDDNLYALYTQVSRGLIRVNADELMYPAHVILRYRLERSLIAGELAVDELPEAWGNASEEFLGVRPEDDRDGCLQDIHWFDGAFGYFPTYTLGAVTAAQLYAAARDADPEIVRGIARGDFAPLFSWLRVNVHERASSVSSRELLVDATGKPLGAAAFERHLRARYLED